MSPFAPRKDAPHGVTAHLSRSERRQCVSAALGGFPMNMMSLLSHCALSQVIGESAEKVMRTLNNRFSDRSHQVIDLLHQAGEKAWKAVEIALAGESLWRRLDAA